MTPSTATQLIAGLTLWRPWAWAIAHANKRIENRPWWRPSLLGTYIAIHSGKTWDYEGAAKIGDVHPEMPRSADLHPLGIIGVARVVGCIQFDDPQSPPIEPSQVKWFFGPFGWVLDDVVAFDVAVPCRGMQGLWPLPRNVLATVRTRWREARERSAAR